MKVMRPGENAGMQSTGMCMPCLFCRPGMNKKEKMIMRKNRLLKQSLAVLLSLSMSLGPCAPGSFAVFADTTGVSSEVETNTGETGTDTEEEADPQAEAEVSEEKSEEASEDSVSAGGSTGEETTDEAEGEDTEDDGKDQGASNQGASDQGASDSGSEETGAGKSDGEGEEAGGSGEGGGSTLEDHNDGVKDGEEVPGDEDDPEGGAGDEVRPSGEGNEDRSAEDGSVSETDSGNKGDASAPDQEKENNIPEEENAASETAAVEAETEKAAETEAAAAAKNDETETEGEVKNSEDRRILQAEVDETIISVIYDDGVFPENVTLEVRKVDEDSAEQEEIREKVEKALKKKEPAKIKEEESAEETEDENGVNVGEESTGVWLSAFEIRVLNEKEEEVEPDPEKGEVFVRFEGITVPDGEDAVFGVEEITVFGLENIANDKVKVLEKVDDPKGEEVSMAAEGAVVDDLSGGKTETSEDSNNEVTTVTVRVHESSIVVLVLDKEQLSLESERLMAAEGNVVDSGYCGRDDGTNLQWTLTGEPGNYTLTISGTGEMEGGALEEETGSVWEPMFGWKMYDQSEIKTLKFEEGITSIGAVAFWDMTGLTGSLVIPDTVKNIGAMAFMGCTGFNGTLTLPEGMDSIGARAFQSCENFKGDLVVSAKSIGSQAFIECGFDGILQLKEGIESIEKYAFEGLKNIKGSLIIPRSIKSIGDSAFANCSSLTGIQMPYGLKKIPDGLVYGCGFEGELKIPDTVEYIGDTAFAFCTGLTGELRIPKETVFLGYGAFEGCTGLTKLSFSNKITEISGCAFYNCSGLKCSLMLPNSVRKIGAWAFSGCGGLTGDLVMPAGLEEVGGEAFSGTSINGQIIMNNSVKKIGEGAFSGLDISSSRIVLPETLETIGVNAFGWGGEKTVVFMGKAPVLTQGVFEVNPVTAGNWDIVNGTIYYPGLDSSWTKAVRDKLDKDGPWIPMNVDAVSIEQFVRRLYTICLDREADASGLRYWKSRIILGNIKGIALAGNFVFSQEFTSKNYCNEHFVRQIYPALLNREPDSDGLNYWVGKLNKGMKREELLNRFASSTEYRDLCNNAGFELGPKIRVPDYGRQPYGPCAVCGNETKVVQFAERMYTVCLDRTAETGGLAFWSKGLYEQTITGKSILENFFLSSEIQGKNLTNREYVRRIYKAMLDRDPDGSGWDYWEGRLNSGASPTAVIAGFIDSNEFTGICSEYGIK